MIDGHGNNVYHFDQIEADFSSNVAFNNRSQLIIDHLSRNISAVSNYPDPSAVVLTGLVAENHGVEVGEVLVTNGSAEGFYLVAHLLSRRGLRRCTITTPSFAEYEDSCRLYGLELSFLPLNRLLNSDLSECDSLWLGAPNNPDGQRIAFADVEMLAAKFPNTIFVVDRAYNDLAYDFEDERVASVAQNIIITNSFTKSYGIPGLRLGYIIAEKVIVGELSHMRPPWSVNSMALVAGDYILNNQRLLAPNIEELIAESKYLQLSISQIDGYRVTPSECNFFLVELCDGRSAAELCEYLVREERMLIRDCANFRGLTPQHFRVAALDREKNDRLVAALRRW